jgi:hypothetical protein
MRPLFAFGWFHGPSRSAVEPPAGKVLFAGPAGYLIRHGLYIPSRVSPTETSSPPRRAR